MLYEFYPIFMSKTGGTYAIGLDHIEGVFENGQAIYLNDTYLNKRFDLSEGRYNFSVFPGEVGVNNHRFELVFTAENLGTEESGMAMLRIYPNPSQGVFRITGVGDKAVTTRIYDLSGKLLLTQNTSVLNLHGLSKGVYLAHISIDGQTWVKKLVLQ